MLARLLPLLPLLSAQWTNAASVDGPATVASLKAAGAKLTAHAPRAKPDAKGCGMPHGITLTRGPTGIVYSPALEIDAALASELTALEKLLQAEAVARLGSEIKKIETLGSYACRTSKGPLTTAYGGKNVLSEHAFGLAFDLKSMTTKNGKVISVARDWSKDTPAGELLRAFRSRALKETGITHVITPDYNAAHHDHLHIDRGLPWGWWFKS